MAIAKLAGVHPRLIVAVQKILYAMQDLGFQMLVTDGVRTVAEQQALYAQGRTAPGDIVTRCDGVVNRSNHQIRHDAELGQDFGYAADCCFLVNGKASWDDSLPWGLYGAMAKALGLVWGGDWPAPKTDRPHVELKA